MSQDAEQFSVSLREELRHRLRPMVGRNPFERGRATTPLELLYDLCFVVAIGRAAKHLGTHVLKGCTIYSTTEPCPMCFSAIHWAQIDRIVFGTGIADVKRLGFNELSISNQALKRQGGSKVVLAQASKRECTDLLKSWAALETKTTY